MVVKGFHKKAKWCGVLQNYDWLHENLQEQGGFPFQITLIMIISQCSGCNYKMMHESKGAHCPPAVSHPKSDMHT